MKKLSLTLIALFCFFKISSAQIIVDANDFASNPAKYNGRTITIKGIKIQIQDEGNSTVGGGSIGGSGNISSGSGASGGSNNAPSTRCTPPKLYQTLNVQFNVPTYEGCFVILSKMATIIPVGGSPKADLTFKADTRTMNKVTGIRLVP